MPAIAEPPFGVTLNALPGTAWLWSRFSDQLMVMVVPSAATDAELIVGGVVSTTKENVELYDEPAEELSTFLARQ